MDREPEPKAEAEAEESCGTVGANPKGTNHRCYSGNPCGSAARFAGFDHRVASFLTWSVCQFSLAMFHQQNEIKPSLGLAGHNSLLSIVCTMQQFGLGENVPKGQMGFLNVVLMKSPPLEIGKCL
ncbi:hypothetical protein V6N13_089953 [Hibiscus sabdariffa]